MNYGYYLEGYSNGVFIREYFEGYKTRAGLMRHVNKFKELTKTVQVGHVEFSFTGGNKYSRGSYRIIDQFNAKAFFEFW